MANKGRLTTGIFCLFLAGLLAWHIALPDRARSETENRTLAQFPDFSWETLKNGSFTEGMEDYFADQFPLRDDWTGLKARCEQMLGKREFNGVYLCGDTLIAKVDEPDRLQAEKNLDDVKRFGEAAHGQVLLGLIPSAAEVWKDRLPQGAPSFDQAAFIQNAAEKTGLPTVDLLGALTEHAGEPIYYRTDHHWTTRGAFYGANALLTALGKESLKEIDFTPEVASMDFNGTLYSTSGIHWLAPDTIEYWVSEDDLRVTSWKSSKEEPGRLYDRSYLEHKDKYSSFLGGNQPLCVLENPAITDGSKLLLTPGLLFRFAGALSGPALFRGASGGPAVLPHFRGGLYGGAGHRHRRGALQCVEFPRGPEPDLSGPARVMHIGVRCFRPRK